MSHIHAHDMVGEAQKCREIAPNVCLQPVEHSNAPTGMVLNTPEADAYGTHHAGFIIGHEREGMPNGQRCEGHVVTDTCAATDGRARWQMTGTLEGGDLTLTPSILCVLGSGGTDERCGFHGFVTNGGWVPA